MKFLIGKTFFRAACLLILMLFGFDSNGQNCNSLNIQFQADIASTCDHMTVTMIHDANNLPYLYVANKEGGLKIYDISDIANPSLVATVPTSMFDMLDVMNLSQSGNYLYLALGNSFTNPQAGGMAIVDVTTPSSPAVTDYYEVPGSSSGGGIVKAEGNYAYLGAMQSGLVILDVTNKANIQFVSQFIPDISFPPVPNPNPNFYNARGMEVKNSTVYLCYDAGGIRIINCTDKFAPAETGRWCNPVMYTPFDHPKAYNNLVLNDSLLYVAVDYCGMEILNVTDTGNIQLMGWWNPYNCPNNNWFTSPGHANEIQFEKNCERVFLATGKGDMVVIDVSNPAQPDSCNFYGGGSNGIGTWGISIHQNEIYLSYICALIPFSSTWTGVKLLTYASCTTGIEEQMSNEFLIRPNPAQDQISIQVENMLNHAELTIFNSLGQSVISIPEIKEKYITIDCKELSSGFYTVLFKNDYKQLTAKLILDR